MTLKHIESETEHNELAERFAALQAERDDLHAQVSAFLTEPENEWAAQFLALQTERDALRVELEVMTQAASSQGFNRRDIECAEREARIKAALTSGQGKAKILDAIREIVGLT